ncbi:MAG: right-handed parallel beta-helix repeat-containing protein [Terriglobales bacterium]
MSTPWQTIAKVNGSPPFSPGDIVLFKAGCIWREQLTVSSSGSPANPITFGTYGTGEAPIISGADLLTRWATEGSLYYSSVSTQPNQVFVDEQRLSAVSAKSSLVTGMWWWDSANSRAYVYDNPSGHTIEGSQRNYGVYVTDKSYIALSGLQAQGTNYRGLYINGGDHLSVTGMVSQYNYGDGFRFDAPTNALVTQSTAAYNGANGFDIYASPAILIDRSIAAAFCPILITDSLS